MASASDQNNYNTGGYIAFIGSMVFTIGFFIYVSFIHKGVDLKEVSQPDSAPAESPAAETPSQDPAPAAGESGPGASRSPSQPWVSSVAQVERGHGLYKTACASCHGVEGKGDGPAARGFQPRDLVAGQWRHGGDSLSLFDTITNGVDGTAMASFAYMPAVDRWALVHYVRSITENVIADNRASNHAGDRESFFSEAAKLN